MKDEICDVLIIGAGVIGMGLARALSKYDIDVKVLEKNSDVSDEVSKANSGIVHAGFDDMPGSVKSNFCVKGNKMFPRLQSDLNIGYRHMPTLVLSFHPKDISTLEQLVERGEKNGVKNIAVISKAEARERESNLHESVCAALYCGESGIVSPYEYGIALAENAVYNGVSIYLEHKVQNIQKIENGFVVKTSHVVQTNQHDTQNSAQNGAQNSVQNREFRAKIVVNAAGLYADTISKLLGIDDYDIRPRKGQYVLYDRDTGTSIQHILFQMPTKAGKGVLVTPTYHGNLLLGPDATEQNEKDNVHTDLESLRNIVQKAKQSVTTLPKQMIRSYAGNRPISSTGDFIIRESKVDGFFELAGISSPGLTASYAIAEHMSKMIVDKYHFGKKSGWHENRKKIIECNIDRKFLPQNELKQFVDMNIGNIERVVCRCEQVREGIIKDACSRNIPITSSDAIKRRTRAGMGTCQGAFCESRVRAVLSYYSKLDEQKITKHGNTPCPSKPKNNQANL